ncbi:peptide-methionine (R)-S-oxide reductase MsrB [Devosia sp. ZB163]|uniref:peptide-methionine (R)-S-oxide reductase MsrB n=1 Tax=Devosia sp. ZB163 TaxID=3025938 RepID=UPI00235F66E5|nr:peptide-methionine (R)-S-oxide reductase MsrB [Devosia sp. ZB163]MDC9823264.1 peptide-methionine (R)-S-oxide reductase MsrB [Devosia sp. ZB163]
MPTNRLNRRFVLLGGTAVAALGAAALLRPMGASTAAEGTFEFTLTDEEWKKRLSPLAYQVLRHEYTEHPGTSELLNEHRTGTFACAGCDLPLFDSKTKYDSHTGWPSFYQPLDNAVGEATDTKLGYPRTEVHCRRCGGHLGHVFNDGPEPTGLRYCMNGVSLVFHPAEG